MRKKTHSCPLAVKTNAGGMFDTMPDELDSLRRAFQKFNMGETLNFLEMMTVISEMVAFYTDCDSPADEVDLLLKNESLNKCRFCP